MQRLEHTPAIFLLFFFSLGKLEGTGILKFDDKSEEKKKTTGRSYSK